MKEPTVRRQVRDIIATAAISPHLTRNPFWDATDQIIPIIRKAERERITKWGIEPCFEHSRDGGVFTRRECPKCWQALGEK